MFNGTPLSLDFLSFATGIRPVHGRSHKSRDPRPLRSDDRAYCKTLRQRCGLETADFFLLLHNVFTVRSFLFALSSQRCTRDEQRMRLQCFVTVHMIETELIRSKPSLMRACEY